MRLPSAAIDDRNSSFGSSLVCVKNSMAPTIPPLLRIGKQKAA
jgi:hypothetical protein